jgi:hypothetical protein
VPAPGSTQPVGGFSALLAAPGRDMYWAMPDNPAPFAGPANLNSSNGFEGIALSADGTTLYPTLEGPVKGADPQTRRMYAFDLLTLRYTGTRRTYRVGVPGDRGTAGFLLSDLTALDDTHFVSLERDNNQGVAAQWKRGFVVDLAHTAPDGALAKRQVVDLLHLRDRAGISLPGRPGDIGLGDPFSMPYVTIEAVLPLGGNRLGIVNDTNFGSTGRNPALPDYSDFIQVRVPGLRNDDDKRGADVQSARRPHHPSPRRARRGACEAGAPARLAVAPRDPHTGHPRTRRHVHEDRPGRALEEGWVNRGHRRRRLTPRVAGAGPTPASIRVRRRGGDAAAPARRPGARAARLPRALRPLCHQSEG